MTDLIPVPHARPDLLPYVPDRVPDLTPKQVRKLARRFARDLELRGKTGQLVIWQSTCVRAYVYRGRWVGDCPAGCRNTQHLTVPPLLNVGYTEERRWDRMDYYVCLNPECGAVANSIEWPAEADEIEDVLNLRPRAMNRNWYPAGHITAVNHGVPDGQSVAELVVENLAHGVT